MFWIMAFSVAGIVLLITKSKILGCKRQFVEQRYQSAKIEWKNNDTPWLVKWFHSWWHAMWTCPMCCGAWVAAILCLFYPLSCGWFLSVTAIFFVNWILHCLENALFGLGEFFEQEEDVT